MQFAILDRSPREMSQTDRLHPRYFLSRVRVSIRPRIFLYAKKPQITVARPAAVDRRSVADTQLNLNGRNPFSRRSSVPRAQREKVVAECSDHGSNLVQRTIFCSFYCLRLTSLLLINPRNIISNIIMIFNINSTRGQTRFLTCVARVTCLVILIKQVRKSMHTQVLRHDMSL